MAHCPFCSSRAFPPLAAGGASSRCQWRGPRAGAAGAAPCAGVIDGTGVAHLAEVARAPYALEWALTRIDELGDRSDWTFLALTVLAAVMALVIGFLWVFR